MRTTRIAFVLLLTACSSDPVDPPVDDSELSPPASGEGIQLEHRVIVEPGQEVWSCRVSQLDSDDAMFINHVESVQNDAMHHMDLMAIALAAPDLAPGDYGCNEVYAQYPQLMDQGITVYASQQSAQEVVLPERTAAMLPPRTLLMHEIHFVNPTDEAVEAYSLINAYAYPAGMVSETIWGGAVRDLEINIPANAHDHVEWTRCVMNDDVDVLFLSTHTHVLGDRTVIRSFDGTTVGDVLYENTDWHAPPLKDMTHTPVHVPAGTGFELECHFNNPSPDPVTWGFLATDEMCQIALVYTPGDSSRACEIVEQGTR